jgi:anti-sigma factor ChrR (cupin superfamily)
MGTALPDEALAYLLAAIAPQVPPVEVAARIKRRVVARIGATETERAAPAFIDVRRGDGWRSLLPGVERKILFDDGVTLSWLLRMQPGASLPHHVHAEGAEECLVLEGEVWANDVHYGPGDYTIALQGSTHHSVRTERGALVFLRSPSPRAMRNSA